VKLRDKKKGVRIEAAILLVKKERKAGRGKEESKGKLRSMPRRKNMRRPPPDNKKKAETFNYHDVGGRRDKGNP